MKMNKIKELLGLPYYQTKDCLIYHADSLATLSLLPAELINLTVTSPPYNIGKAYEQTMPLEEFLDWRARWF